jgi:hypothetical protein
VYLEEIGETEVVVFDKKGESGHVCTIVVRGSSQPLMDDVERAIDDAVNTYKALTKDDRVLLLVVDCALNVLKYAFFSFSLVLVRWKLSLRVRLNPLVSDAPISVSIRSRILRLPLKVFRSNWRRMLD